jgi:protein-tyrosine phosphatase
VLSGASRRAEPPAADPDVVEARLAGRVELLLDGGVSRLAEPSCVLRLGRGRFELLREGLFTLEQLRGAAGLRLAFVCTGNTCRSPMAEGLARKLLAERLEVQPARLAEMGFEVASRGVFAPSGEPASKLSLVLMKEQEIDLSGHRARVAVPEEMARFDRVYCLTRSHREALLALLPPGKGRHVEVLDPQGRDVPDPIGGTLDDYRDAAGRIQAAVRARLDEWA